MTTRITIVLFIIVIASLYKLDYIQIGKTDRSIQPPDSIEEYRRKVDLRRATSPLTYPTPVPDPNFIQIPKLSEWKTYQSNKVGYSIQVPPGWSGYISEDDSALNRPDYDRDYLTSLLISPQDEERFVVCSNSISIDYPYSISGPHKKEGKIYEGGLEGLKDYYQSKDKSLYKSLSVKDMTIDRKPAIKVVILSAKDQSPHGCSGNGYTVHIDMQNGKILTLSGYKFQESSIPVKEIFNQMIQGLKFI